MKTLKRRLILLAVTAAFIAFMGGATHSPPSVIDAVTGATRKSKKNTSEYNGSYIIGINTEIAEKSEIIAICSGEGTAMCASGHIRLFIPESDSKSNSYAKEISERLEKSGFDTEIRRYSDTMLRSRIVSEKYDIFIAADELIDSGLLHDTDYIYSPLLQSALIFRHKFHLSVLSALPCESTPALSVLTYEISARNLCCVSQ